MSTEFQTINIQQIIKNIPHRYPLLLVDKVIDMKLNKSIIGIKNVTFNEPHFTGHFPGKPIMPGVLIIESMAQTAGILIACSSSFKPEDKLIYFTSIENAKFRKPVIPGDVLELHIQTKQRHGSLWKMYGEAIVEGKVVAESTFSAMVVDKKDA